MSEPFRKIEKNQPDRVRFRNALGTEFDGREFPFAICGAVFIFRCFRYGRPDWKSRQYA